MNTDCDYSSAYVSLYADGGLVGHGMTFTIGRGNEIVRNILLPFYFTFPCLFVAYFPLSTCEYLTDTLEL